MRKFLPGGICGCAEQCAELVFVHTICFHFISRAVFITLKRKHRTKDTFYNTSHTHTFERRTTVQYCILVFWKFYKDLDLVCCFNKITSGFCWVMQAGTVPAVGMHALRAKSFHLGPKWPHKSLFAGNVQYRWTNI